ncbi:MAG: response regulator [Methylococcales bacterium]|nr:response regulator [Methylococcales bacterium]
MSLSTSSIDKHEHIFLIEDNEAMYRLIEIILTKAGYSVHVYTNPLVFLKAIPEFELSIIVTDMNMPLMSGVELQTELDHQGGSMPMIFISGEASVGQSIIAMKQGALEFLIKPFKNEELIAAVKSAFELVAKNNRYLIKKNALEAELKELSPRERTVFDLLIMGYNNAQIMKTLGISLPTTKQYKSAVMRKLRVSSLSELIEMQINYE